MVVVVVTWPGGQWLTDDMTWYKRTNDNDSEKIMDIFLSLFNLIISILYYFLHAHGWLNHSQINKNQQHWTHTLNSFPSPIPSPPPSFTFYYNQQSFVTIGDIIYVWTASVWLPFSSMLDQDLTQSDDSQLLWLKCWIDQNAETLGSLYTKKYLLPSIHLCEWTLIPEQRLPAHEPQGNVHRHPKACMHFPTWRITRLPITE